MCLKAEDWKVERLPPALLERAVQNLLGLFNRATDDATRQVLLRKLRGRGKESGPVGQIHALKLYDYIRW